MQYAINVPNLWDYGDARLLADLAYETEQAGWDGFFVWDHMLGDGEQMPANCDPWIALAAIAMRTSSIRIGPMVTPVARRRPWKLSREVVSLDHLSGGRVTLGVGLGYPLEVDFGRFSEEADARVLAQKLDEGIEILTGLWSGEPFSYHGTHYQIRDVRFIPRPVQQPRIPIWVAGVWPNRAPMRRAARWDGAFPMRWDGELSLGDIRGIRTYIAEHRTTAEPFDIIIGGSTPGDNPQAALDKVALYAEAGVTWWSEGIEGPPDELRTRLRQGPPPRV